MKYTFISGSTAPWCAELLASVTRFASSDALHGKFSGSFHSGPDYKFGTWLPDVVCCSFRADAPPRVTYKRVRIFIYDLLSELQMLVWTLHRWARAKVRRVTQCASATICVWNTAVEKFFNYNESIKNLYECIHCAHCIGYVLTTLR